VKQEAIRRGGRLRRKEARMKKCENELVLLVFTDNSGEECGF
jgi:hypothetical protein